MIELRPVAADGRELLCERVLGEPQFDLRRVPIGDLLGQREAAEVGVERIREVGVEDRVGPCEQDGVPDELVVDVPDPAGPRTRAAGSSSCASIAAISAAGGKSAYCESSRSRCTTRLPESASASRSSSRRRRIRAGESVTPCSRSHEPGLPAGGTPAKTVTTVALGAEFAVAGEDGVVEMCRDDDGASGGFGAHGWILSECPCKDCRAADADDRRPDDVPRAAGRARGLRRRELRSGVVGRPVRDPGRHVAGVRPREPSTSA